MGSARNGGITVKKTTKKLALSRETLRTLGETTLVEVAGAAVTKIDCTRPNASCISTAPTCFNCSAAVACTTP
jgi:hypothetical protein